MYLSFGWYLTLYCMHRLASEDPNDTVPQYP